MQVKIISTYWKESNRYKDSFIEQLAHELESKQYNYKESLIVENDNSLEKYLYFNIDDKIIVKVTFNILGL